MKQPASVRLASESPGLKSKARVVYEGNRPLRRRRALQLKLQQDLSVSQKWDAMGEGLGTGGPHCFCIGKGHFTRAGLLYLGHSARQEDEIAFLL